MARRSGIGRLKERSLHAALVRWYSVPTDRREVKVGGFIADLKRGTQLIEIQTGSFGHLRRKLERLLENHRVRLVYPVPKRKWIVRVAASGQEPLGRRKSSRTGKPADVFYELVSLADLFLRPNLSLDVLMIEEEEVRCADGRGSWWRKGVSILDRRLVRVIDRIELHTGPDFLALLPKNLGKSFTNRDLAAAAGFSLPLARRATYCLRCMRLLRRRGKRGRETIFSRAPRK